jgi:hypothetical protein
MPPNVNTKTQKKQKGNSRPSANKTHKTTHKKTNNNNIEINALTYNLCWGCMSANEKSQYDRTAEYLAVKCMRTHKQTGQHQCATNITNNIAAGFIKNTRTGICDILALQEATNWRLVYDGLHNHQAAKTAGFADLGYIHHLTKTDTGALAELCTIYNRRRFELKQAAIGDIGNGRPFQIIRLWCPGFSRELIVINLHNSHNGSANVIQVALNNLSSHKVFTRIPTNGCLDAGIYAPSSNNDSDKLQIGPNPFILFMGDTNDHGHFKLWRGFKPLHNLYDGDSNVSNQSRKPPIKSCCAPVGNSSKIRTGTNSEDFAYGDYILASDNLKFLVNNIVPQKGINHDATLYPASDHLPVLSVLSARI